MTIQDNNKDLRWLCRPLNLGKLTTQAVAQLEWHTSPTLFDYIQKTYLIHRFQALTQQWETALRQVLEQNPYQRQKRHLLNTISVTAALWLLLIFVAPHFIPFILALCAVACYGLLVSSSLMDIYRALSGYSGVAKACITFVCGASAVILPEICIIALAFSAKGTFNLASSIWRICDELFGNYKSLLDLQSNTPPDLKKLKWINPILEALLAAKLTDPNNYRKVVENADSLSKEHSATLLIRMLTEDPSIDQCKFQGVLATAIAYGAIDHPPTSVPPDLLYPDLNSKGYDASQTNNASNYAFFGQPLPNAPPAEEGNNDLLSGKTCYA